MLCAAQAWLVSINKATAVAGQPERSDGLKYRVTGSTRQSERGVAAGDADAARQSARWSGTPSGTERYRAGAMAARRSKLLMALIALGAALVALGTVICFVGPLIIDDQVAKVSHTFTAHTTRQGRSHTFTAAI